MKFFPLGIGTPLSVTKNESIKGTPNMGTPLSVSKLRGDGISANNDRTPVDVPKLRPGNEPPTPPNKNDAETNVVPDVEDVQTIKKHLFDSPVVPTTTKV